MSLLGLGNPLLDISASVDAAYLEKYELKPFDAILAEEKHDPIYADLMENYKPDYFAGGSAQNTIRVAQWMMPKKKDTSYLGCVGDDKYAKTLGDEVTAAGVNAHYLVDPKEPTGTCAVLVQDKDRSLVTKLGAANHFKIDHLKTEATQKLVNQSRIVYVSGFFLTVSPPSARYLAEHAAANDKTFVLSLAAPFIVDFFNEPLGDLLPYADFIVGNEHEAVAFGKKWGFGETQADLPEIALKLAALPKVNKSRPRTVIFTQGPDETLIVSNNVVRRFAVIPCPRENIVDLNGAGDSWLGGFLAYLTLGSSIERCVEAANYAANVVIQRGGCSYPKSPSFETPTIDKAAIKKAAIAAAKKDAKKITDKKDDKKKGKKDDKKGKKDDKKKGKKDKKKDKKKGKKDDKKKDKKKKSKKDKKKDKKKKSKKDKKKDKKKAKKAKDNKKKSKRRQNKKKKGKK